MTKGQKDDVGGVASGDDSLQRVKDILFGSDVKGMHEQHERFATNVEDKIQQAAQRLTEKLDTIEEFVKKTSQSLSAQLQHESATRAKEDETLREMLLDGVSRNSRELHVDIDKQGESIERKIGYLSDAKLDRAMLAKMFNDYAAKILGHGAEHGGH